MGREIDLTQEYLRSIMHYDEDTGVFTWKMRPDRNASWNTRYADKESSWKHSNGYRQTCINYKKYFLHRLAWFYVHGAWPKEIDHIDRNKANNAISNLREVSHVINCDNRKQRKNPLGLRGVTYSKRDGTWLARITINGKSKHIGSFSSPELASEAYAKAASK